MAERPAARMRRIIARTLLPALLLLISWGAQAAGDNPARTPPAQATRLGERQAASLEKHIATLHGELHITPMQEPLWQPFTAAMRDSVAQLDHVYAQRESRRGAVSAVDDLRSYALVQQIRAQTVQALIGPFQRLYNSFSPSQKRQADETFHKFTDNAIRSPR